MILIKSITIKDFISHEKTEIDFKENQKILLSGKSGSGKSSIGEALLFSLYGRGRSENKSLIRKGSTGGATVSLRLADGTLETIITRSVSVSGKNSLNVTQNTGAKGQFLPIARTGIRDIQDWIEKDLLKASYELFTNSVVYPQENENSFVKANATRRKDLLLEIVGASNFDNLYEKTRTTLNINQTESAVTLSRIEELNQKIAEASKLSQTLAEHQEKLINVALEVDALTTKEKDVETTINGISHLARQIEDKGQVRRLLVNSVTSATVQLLTYEKMELTHAKVDIAQLKKDSEEIVQLELKDKEIQQSLIDNSIVQQRINAHLSNRPSVFDYTEEIKGINKRLIELMKEVGKCPAKEACPFAIPVNGQIQFLTEQIEEKSKNTELETEAFARWEKAFNDLPKVVDTTDLYNQQKEVRTRIESLSKSKELFKQYEDFEKGLVDFQKQKQALEEKKATETIELEKLDKEIEDLKTSLGQFDLNKLNNDLAIFRIELRAKEKEKEEAALNMNLALVAQNTLKDASSALLQLQAGLVKTLEDQESLELLKEAFSPRGVKAVIIDYLVPNLEDRINEVLSQMSDFRIRLDTQASLADGEGTKEGLFITVKTGLGEELPISNLSGGEGVKVSMAISEALAGLMNQTGFRVLDECITSLDPESTAAFVKVLIKLQEKFPQVVVISHLNDVKDVINDKIKVVKINGVSRIEV